MSDKELDELQADIDKLEWDVEPRDTISKDFVARVRWKGKEIMEIYTTRFYVLRDGYGITQEAVSVIQRLQQKKLTNYLVG